MQPRRVRQGYLRVAIDRRGVDVLFTLVEQYVHDPGFRAAGMQVVAHDKYATDLLDNRICHRRYLINARSVLTKRSRLASRFDVGVTII